MLFHLSGYKHSEDNNDAHAQKMLLAIILSASLMPYDETETADIYHAFSAGLSFENRKTYMM